MSKSGSKFRKQMFGQKTGSKKALKKIKNPENVTKNQETQNSTKKKIQEVPKNVWEKIRKPKISRKKKSGNPKFYEKNQEI